MSKAKIFQNGKSQAVRLPKEFRLQCKEVSITRLGNGIVLQPILRTWSDVFKELKKIHADYILTDLEDFPPQEREVFKKFK